jgi:plastocyanin
MEPENSDQQQFDQDVDRVGKRVLEVAAGVGIFAALVMSIVALLNSGHTTTTTVRVVGARQAAAPAVPASAQIAIDHVMRGCHNLAVNGGSASSPNATLHLAVGGKLTIQNNDVMPHQVYLRSGPTAAFVAPMMNHLGAASTVTFAKPGTYLLGTHPGEDYTSGVQTVGADHVLRIKVLVT